MAKFARDAIMDAALSTIIQNVNLATVTSTQPTTYGSAVGADLLARVVMSAGDFTIGDGDVSGRKVTVGQKTGIPVSVTGTGDHVNLLQTSGSLLWYTTTATSQALTQGNTLTINAWDIEFADPS